MPLFVTTSGHKSVNSLAIFMSSSESSRFVAWVKQAIVCRGSTQAFENTSCQLPTRRSWWGRAKNTGRKSMRILNGFVASKPDTLRSDSVS